MTSVEVARWLYCSALYCTIPPRRPDHTLYRSVLIQLRVLLIYISQQVNKATVDSSSHTIITSKWARLHVSMRTWEHEKPHWTRFLQGPVLTIHRFKKMVKIYYLRAQINPGDRRVSSIRGHGRTRTRTNTNPNDTEANAAGRSVRACVARKSK